MNLKLEDILQNLESQQLYKDAVNSVSDGDKQKVETMTRDFITQLVGPLLDCINAIDNNPGEIEKLRTVINGSQKDESIITLNGDGK